MMPLQMRRTLPGLLELTMRQTVVVVDSLYGRYHEVG
jgi:hypothetical protein